MATQQSFDFGKAEKYMAVVFGFEVTREQLNKDASTVRQLARDQGVPIKAVELAIKTERNHRKAIDLVTQEEFDALRRLASIMVEAQEEVAELAEKGPSVLGDMLQSPPFRPQNTEEEAQGKL